MLFYFLFFKQKTAYEMRISDWSSDVCSSDLVDLAGAVVEHRLQAQPGDTRVVAQHLVDDVVPHRDDLAGLDPGLQLVLHDLLRAQGVAAMHEVDLARDVGQEIGRASCRERVCQYV